MNSEIIVGAVFFILGLIPALFFDKSIRVKNLSGLSKAIISYLVQFLH